MAAWDWLGASADPLVTAGRAAVAFAVVYLLGRYLLRPALVGIVRARNRRNPTLVAAVRAYVHLVVLLLALLAAIAAAGYVRVVAGSALLVAVATLVVGVAGQAVVGNLVAGVFLTADPEFNVGDWIDWPDGEGIVETVRLRITRVRTPNGEMITVPNTVLATSPVTRPYARSRFRVDLEFGVAFDGDPEDIADVVRAAAEREEAIAAEPSPSVLLQEVGTGVTTVQVQFWVADPDQAAVNRARSAFVARLSRRLAEIGATVPPPSGQELSGTVGVDTEP